MECAGMDSVFGPIVFKHTHAHTIVKLLYVSSESNCWVPECCNLCCGATQAHPAPPRCSLAESLRVEMAPLCCQVTLLAFLLPGPSGAEAVSARDTWAAWCRLPVWFTVPCVWRRTGGIRLPRLPCDQSSQITAQVRPITIKHRI